MSIRRVEVQKVRSYYYSTFNPVKIFGSLAAARNYENQFALTESQMRCFTFYDKNKNKIKWNYRLDENVEWRMENRKLIETITFTPRFYCNKSDTTLSTNMEEVGFFFIYDRARYIQINVDPQDHSEYQKRKREMNRGIRILNGQWKMNIPTIKGTYKFSKKNGWEPYLNNDLGG